MYITSFPSPQKSHITACTIKGFSLALLASISLPSVSLAQSVTVVDGQTLNTGVSATSVGDVVLVEMGGTINSTAAGVPAVSATNADQSITNHGTLTTTSTAANGVTASGENATITNTGTISTTNTNSSGIISTGNNGNVTNSGEITTTGVATVGIGLNGTDSQATNASSGNISITGANSVGMLTYGTNNLLRNEGSITVDGTNNIAMQSAGDGTTLENAGILNVNGSSIAGIAANALNTKVTNSGIINVKGTTATGINVISNNAVVTNTGTINAQSAGRQGISITGTGSSLISRGQIFAGADDAVNFIGNADNTLTLGAGNLIEGNIRLGGGTDTVNVERGLSVHYTFEKAPENLNTFGAPQSKIDTAIDVFDTTATANIQKSLDRLLEGTFDSLPTQPAQKRSTGLWATGFGGWQENKANGPNVNSTTATAGAAIGFDQTLDNDLRLGIFAGLGGAHLSTQTHGQTIETSNQFAGFYGSFGEHIDFAVATGMLQHNSKRTVLNNLATGGFETAAAQFNGYFVAPEVTFTTNELSFGSVPLTPSFTGRYTFQQIGAHAETGSTSNAQTNARNVHSFQATAKIDAALVSSKSSKINVNAGIASNVNWGANQVTTTINGITHNYDPGVFTNQHPLSSA